MAVWSKRQRLEAALRGEPADRLPAALWRHFPGDDQRAEDQARSHIEFAGSCDFDFVKVTPSSTFCVEDWGGASVYEGNLEGTRVYTRRALGAPADWGALAPLDAEAGALGRQLDCLRRLRAAFGDATPFIQTLFNPLTQARYLAGEAQVLSDMRRRPADLLAGLRVITERTARFAAAAIRAGAAGVFLATQLASYRLMGEEEYRRFGVPFDRQVLDALPAGAWLNVLHLHGDDVMFDLLADYPVGAINWHDREAGPALGEALGRTPATLIGGLRQWETMMRGTPDDVRAEIADAVRQTAGRRLIIGTGCVTPIVAPQSNLWAARQAVDNYRPSAP